MNNSPITRSIMVEHVDVDSLVASITAAVMKELRPTLSASSSPMLVDGDEMARLASVSPQLIDKLRAAGTIPSVMAGRRRLYQPDAVIDALANEKGGGENGK